MRSLRQNVENLTTLPQFRQCQPMVHLGCHISLVGIEKQARLPEADPFSSSKDPEDNQGTCE